MYFAYIPIFYDFTNSKWYFTLIMMQINAEIQINKKNPCYSEAYNMDFFHPIYYSM